MLNSSPRSSEEEDQQASLQSSTFAVGEPTAAEFAAVQHIQAHRITPQLPPHHHHGITPRMTGIHTGLHFGQVNPSLTAHKYIYDTCCKHRCAPRCVPGPIHQLVAPSPMVVPQPKLPELPCQACPTSPSDICSILKPLCL